MKKKLMIIILVVVFVLALVAINIFLSRQNETGTEGKDKQENAKQEEKVIEVTSQNFEEVLKSEKPVLIDFYATWCGPCKILSPIVEEAAKENENVKFVKIDIDKTDDIAMQYQVMSIPTLVLIQNGEEKDRVVGILDKNQILDFIKGK